MDVSQSHRSPKPSPRGMMSKHDSFEAVLSWRIYEIITGDESCIYQYDLETNRQSTVSVFQNDLTPNKVKQSISAEKILIDSFF